MAKNSNAGAWIAGIAAGVVASRVLPPLVGMASGAIRSQMGQDAFDLLITQHREMLTLMDRMLQTEQDATARRSAMFLSLKRVLAKHAMAEEDVVYPMLFERGQQEEIRKHYAEHGEIKILLYEIEQCVMNGTDWNEPVSKLRDMVHRHGRDEEVDEFPKLRGALDEKKRAKLAGDIRREEAMVL